MASSKGQRPWRPFHSKRSKVQRARAQKWGKNPFLSYHSRGKHEFVHEGRAWRPTCQHCCNSNFISKPYSEAPGISVRHRGLLLVEEPSFLIPVPFLSHPNHCPHTVSFSLHWSKAQALPSSAGLPGGIKYHPHPRASPSAHPLQWDVSFNV